MNCAARTSGASPTAPPRPAPCHAPAWDAAATTPHSRRTARAAFTGRPRQLARSGRAIAQPQDHHPQLLSEGSPRAEPGPRTPRRHQTYPSHRRGPGYAVLRQPHVQVKHPPTCRNAYAVRQLPNSGCAAAVTGPSHSNAARTRRSLSPSWSRATRPAYSGHCSGRMNGQFAVARSVSTEP